MEYDYLIIGAGIIGMTVAYELKNRFPDSRIKILEKEDEVGFHASGRNSGVLHAGFYYTADSLKARFTVDGNKLMKKFCTENNIFVNNVGKLVVAKNETELEGLRELERRAKVNGVDLEMISEEKAKEIDSNVKTYKFALWSPSTASVNPKEVCQVLKADLLSKGVEFEFGKAFSKETSKDKYKYLINAAGLYADKIAKEFGLAKQYTLLPFKGKYSKYFGGRELVTTNIYPVPNLGNPFLGVHYTITNDNSIKIGPTATPVFWREAYSGLKRFNVKEFFETSYFILKLFMKNKFNFRNLAFEEMKNYKKKYFQSKAGDMVNEFDPKFKPMPAGIRAQLLDKKTLELVQDFVIEKDSNSLHVLNAVSPAFTCSFAFAKYVVDNIEKD